VPWTLPRVADSLVDLLSSDTWDLTDVEVRGGGGEGGGEGGGV
jgi:hypothetical protein